MTGSPATPGDVPPADSAPAAMADRSLRLFVALWPAPPVRDAIAAWQAVWSWPAGAKLVPAGQLHLTLQFLGNVPQAALPGLIGALRGVPATPFTTAWGRAQDWDGIAVLRPLAASDGLQALHARCGEAVRAAGLASEARRLRPHVTLARKARGAVPPAQALQLAWACDGGFALVQSVGQGGGYRVLQAFPAG